MNHKKISLAKQIKTVIGTRILICSVFFIFIIFCLTIYDLSMSVNQLRARINEQIKPIENFAISQGIINNLDTVNLKIEYFNANSQNFQIDWIRNGKPTYKTITWLFPSSWVYDYPLGNIAGYQFGYFRIVGSFFTDKELIYDLFFRLIVMVMFIISILVILYPLANKIPKQLFIDPINRFINIILNNPTTVYPITKLLPRELNILEENIFSLLKTAREHERNQAAIELGLLSAHLAHDIQSPLVAMEMGLESLAKKPTDELALNILKTGIQSVRDIANNVLDRYPGNMPSSNLQNHDNGNKTRPLLLFSVIETILSQKKHEWCQQPCQLIVTIKPQAKITWIMAAPNEVKRILSNLLNNAYEALIQKNKGIITLTLEYNHRNLHLHMHDNGVGIPVERIKDVLNGQSLKSNGKGLGLSGANQYMKNLNGKLKINSKIKKGTTVSLTFPTIDNIEWFPTHISLKNARTAIILDDDTSMLTYWQTRIKETGLLLKLFSSYNEALEWVDNNNIESKSAIFLVDYKLSHSINNGLTFLKKIFYNPNRYLITHNAERYDLQEQVKESGVWLIPKVLVNEINFIL